MAAQEPLELKITNETIPSAQIGTMSAEPPPDDEVGGRGMQVRLVRCGSCGNVGYINYDTVNYRAYACSNCNRVGAAN